VKGHDGLDLEAVPLGHLDELGVAAPIACARHILSTNRHHTSIITPEKLKLTSNTNKCVCAQSVNKIITMRNLNNTKILLTKWKLNMRKTTQGQPNPGYPLFRRQD